jgi:hypothetical protein
MGSEAHPSELLALKIREDQDVDDRSAKGDCRGMTCRLRERSQLRIREYPPASKLNVPPLCPPPLGAPSASGNISLIQGVLLLPAALAKPP